MPGFISPAAPVGVLPFSLSTKFSAANEWASLRNEYHDGSAQIAPLTISSRRTWKISKRLTPAEMLALRTFYFTHTADAFYFYDPKETVPPYTYDITGGATAGRYTVRFNSDWSQTMDIPRNNADLELVELDGSASSHGLSISASLYVITSHIPGTGYTAAASANLGSGLNLFDASAYSNRTDLISVWNAGTWSAGVGPLAAIAYPVATNVTFWIDGTIGGSASPADKFRIYDCYMDVTYSDATVIRYRPSIAAGIPNDDGTITNPSNAIDGNPVTYCEIDRSSFGHFSRGCQLTLSRFS